jgi:hypothetical protein
MPTTASIHRSSFGTDCVQCGNELIAPEWSEHRDERHILHLWRCPPEWRPRKEAYLAKLPAKPPQSLPVSLADKTHNAEAILFDYR